MVLSIFYNDNREIYSIHWNGEPDLNLFVLGVAVEIIAFIGISLQVEEKLGELA